MKKEFQKTRQNNYITIFKALKLSLQCFTSVQKRLYYQLYGSARLKRILIAALLLSVVITSTTVFSQSRSDERTIGTTSSLNVHPGVFTTNDWFKPENSLQVDLSDEALFQKFSERNAAFLPTIDELEELLNNSELRPSRPTAPSVPVSSSADDPGSRDAVEVIDGEIEAATEDTQPVSGAEPESEPVSASQPETEAETQSGEPESEQEPESEPVSEEVSVYQRAGSAMLTAFTRVVDSFAYVNANETLESDTAVIASPEDSLPIPSPEISDVVDSYVNSPEPEVDHAHTPDEFGNVEPHTHDELEVAEETPAQTPPNDTDSSEVSIGGEISDVIPSPVEVEAASNVEQATSTETFASEPVVTDDREQYKITFNDFGIPDLEPGEFITGVQLRASLAARATTQASGTLPYFEFSYVTPSSTQVVGSVLVDEEVSTALNGGYFLLPLPSIETESQLDDVTIEVAYVGAREDIEAVYFDAVWLEVHTEKITRADLIDRTYREIMNNLRQPTANEFVSERLDFMRDEAPVFNLRYVSQRSAVVQSVRNLFGYNKVKIENVELLHSGVEAAIIKPNVNVTTDGLISITFPEDEMEKLKPGQYEVQFEVDEGGYTFMDSFNFQWGMLAINPDQTEYEIGEAAQLSMGALTPNGNTLCVADLRLFVIDPAGFIHRAPIQESGLCNGNNVVDVPDYSSLFTPTLSGTHELYLERLAEDGSVIAHTSDTFEVVDAHDLSITRSAPTRIYPAAPYESTLTVASDVGFDGFVIERVPASFEILETEAIVETVGEFKELTWKVELEAGISEPLSYTFDAPDLSPYLFELGPAAISGTSPVTPIVTTASSSSTEPVLPISQNIEANFTEHRQWQIASDAVGNMILYWDNATSIPAGWTCLSCGSGTFYQRFAMGSSTYNTTGGVATHNHSAGGSVQQNPTGVTESGSGSVAPTGHSHTYTPTISTTSNLPSYRHLRVIQYTNAAGEPPTIPAGAIGIFDVASSSLPVGWNRYAAQDGYYVYGENTPGTTGGADTHTHTITGTTGASTGAGTQNRGGTGSGPRANDTHTHTVSGATVATNHEPPYIAVVLAQLSSTSTPPNSLITMWTEDTPSGWTDISTSPSAAFNQRFIKPATSYGATGGGYTHTPANVTGITSSGNTGTVTARSGGTAGSNTGHTHSVDVTSFSVANNLPPYLTVVFGKREGTEPVFDQLSYRWYVNNASAVTPTDPWPSGGIDLSEQSPVTFASTPVKPSDVLRLRMNLEVANATATASTSLQLQYAEADVCSEATTWLDVGDSASSTALWRGYDNGSLVNGATLPSTVLASSTEEETYEEQGYSTTTVNDIAVDGVGEWDFVLTHNGAEPGVNYCFRLVEGDGSTLSSYSTYPVVLTDAAPESPTLSKLFDNEKTASTTGLKFQFVSEDPEGDDLHYEIEIDDDYAFGSILEDRNTISNATQFENQVNLSDKAPFTSGELMEFSAASSFTNGTTYYWRVRANDPDGSNEWGVWSEVFSFTIDNTLTATAWFQTTDEQFAINELTGVETTGSDSVDLITGSTTGTLASDPIVFSDAERGTAWDSLTFTDVETSGDLKYQIQYLTGTSTWTAIPDGALAGNSTGFDTSPVDLLGLDVDDYSTLRIVATFTNSGGSPVLNDWTLNWGFRVETPTITKLFSSEKTGTTTPTFEFTTSDPQNDSLTYQISWSTDNTFVSGTTTRTSDAATGFTNIDNGVDSDPFDSGDAIQFQVQPGDALTNGTTYWWRVRAKDTTGDNAWSFWTEPRSFTVDTTVVASTWFQTTEEQFDSNVLSGTIALTNDTVAVATTASEAIIVYGEGTETAPRYRQWDGADWGSEGTLDDIAAPVRWAVARAAIAREEYIAVTAGTDSDVNAQIFTNGQWDDLLELTTNMGDTTARGFDVVYETLSSDAVVVYCDGAADPSYRVWNGSTWSAESTINAASASDCRWLELAADPTSDEIALVMRDAVGGAYESFIWNGSTWGNTTTFGAPRDATYSGVSIRYENSGGDALSAVPASGGGPNRMTRSVWNGTTWTTTAAETIDGRIFWSDIARNDSDDNMVLCYQNDNTDVQAIRWTGAAFTGDTELTATARFDTDQAFDCIYQTVGSSDNDILAVYSDTTNTKYRTWDSGTGWAAASQINSIGLTATMQLIRTGTGNILGAFFDDTNDDLVFSTWSGSAWSSTQTLETDMSVGTTPYGHPYWMAPRNAGSEGTTIVSDGIDFDDGLGPYWDEMSWNDTTPGTSDILYSVQYWDGDSWEFIPNGQIPNNDVGTSTGTIDLSGLNKNTYNIIRPYAALACDGSSNCPQLQDWTVTWAQGITVSGTLQQYDQTTNVNSGTVAVAVNGTLQTGKTGSVSAGAWSIPNVTVFAGDVVSVFVSDTSDTTEAVGVTLYDGLGDINGISMFERHVSLGSYDATTTPLTNVLIGAYGATNDEDVFLDLIGSTTLDLCADASCYDVRLYIASTTRYTPGGNLMTHDIENDGTITSSATIDVSGSWDNNGTTTLTNSTVVMSATSTTESIDTTGAAVGSFFNLTFGTSTGSASWTLGNALDVDGALSVTRGTLARGTTAITVAGNLATGANGFWSGLGTTTFDGATVASWSDQNAVKQNAGRMVIDGTSKAVTLGSDVRAQSLLIGSDDTLDVTVGNYTLTVLEGFTNNNNFLPRQGEVVFAATTSTYFIDDNADGFYDLTFNGAGGAWAFADNTVAVGNDFTIVTGTVTLPTGTTTIAGSFANTGGAFAHSNAVVAFTSAGAETIATFGDAFNNHFYDLYFNGGGSWTFTETNASTTDDLIINAGTVIAPTGVLAVGGDFSNLSGNFTSNGGTLHMYSNSGVTLAMGASSLNTLLKSGSGTATVTNTNLTLTGDLIIDAGTLVAPTGTFTIGGSFDNNATYTASNGSILFNSSDAGETIDFGASSAYNVTLNAAGGGWTMLTHATATNNFALTAANDFTLSGSQVLSVGNNFTNSVGGASTTWTGSTLSLTNGTYSVNTKNNAGDAYENLIIGASAQVSMWNSQATSTTIVAGGYLYSQDHAENNGDLYIYGTYTRTSGTEYWNYATDFDGAVLTGGNERQVDVRFASGATAGITGSTLQMLGSSAASTTVANQGSGTYTVTVSGSTVNAQYYNFADLGGTGLSLAGSNTVTSLSDGYFTVAGGGGTAITLSSTTIDAAPGKQIQRVGFATTTAIAATNVTQTDGTPASYWWFRNSYGNIDGEAFDNDTGNPGSVRWDDSALVLTISGRVYSDDGATLLGGTTCDGDVNQPVTVVVEGGATYTGVCTATSSFSVSGVVVVGDPTLTVYLNGADGGERAVAVTKTPTADITDLDLYANRLIVRHEDAAPLTIADLASFDDSDDPTDINFTAATGTVDTLTLEAGNELYVWHNKNFVPGGVVTLAANASADSFDGTLHLGANATFTGAGTTTYTIGGSLDLESGATLVPASSTILMTATTTGKTLTASATGTIDVHELQFTGVGGGWNINGDIDATADIYVQAGTVTGTADVTLASGSLYGNGALSFGAGTTTIATTNTLGGTQAWTFYDLTLGNSSTLGTTTPASTATTTVLGRLTITSAHFLDAGSSQWNLSGSGTVFVEAGNFLEDTSTVTYSGTGATNILSTNYYNLILSALGGAPTYTATGLGIQVFSDMQVGGATATNVTFDTNDTALNVDGNFTITSNGTFVASNSGTFTLAGNYDNNGVFTASGGSILFDGSGTRTIAAGASSFATAHLLGSGDYTITEHATATAFSIYPVVSGFTLSSGQTLAVGGTFNNYLGGGATEFTGSFLSLYGGGNYLINPATSSDTYGTLTIGTNTQILSWNSSAGTTNTLSGASLYSQDHAGNNGDLYIFGDYVKTTGIDHWSYVTDFDGTSISGSPRLVEVYVEGGGSALFAGTSQLSVLGISTASSTIQNQGSGVYAMTLGGTASTTMNYYAFSDLDGDGLTFTATPNVVNLSYGRFEVANTGDTAITVGGTALNSSPARTFTANQFATSSGVTSAVNVTATGTSVSSWRFTNHYGDIDGETYDVDPDGDPGYVVWDNSAANISISGTVYDTDESSVSNVCPGANIRVRVAGLTTYDAACDGGGVYTVTGVTYSPGDSIVAYIEGETENGATVTVDPVSNINNFHIYENRLIVRHEGTNPITIDDVAVWDASDVPGDLDFTAVSGSPDTLSLPADRELIVWTDKEFAPGGNVTLANGGSQAYGGGLELQSNADYTAAGTEVLSIGGSLTAAAGATFSAANSTTTFTTSGAGRTVDTNDYEFYNVAFTGSGDWTVSNSILGTNNFTISNGSVTLPTGTTTVSGYLSVSGGGDFAHNGGSMVFDGTGTGNIVAFNGSTAGGLRFTGSGSWNMTDVNATSTGGVTITDGTVSLPSGTLALANSFRNEGGAVTHNTSEISISTSTPATVLASSSDLFAVTFGGGGTFAFEDEDLTLLGSLTLNSGALGLASGTMSVGGSFLASGGTFNSATGTILFNSTDTGETINPGNSAFYNVVFGSGTGGWTITNNATTTNIFSLTTASNFTLQSGAILYVGGVFSNDLANNVTTWTGSALVLNSATEYEINAKTTGDDYETLQIGAGMDLSSWNSRATTTLVDSTSSFYSQDHGAVNGSLYIYGDYLIATTTEYWSYATDFDGTSLSGVERAVTVALASGATTTVDGGTLNIIGVSGNASTITNQGSGQYSFNVSAGTLNAQHYAFRNLDATGVNLSGTPTITSLSNGDFELAVAGGRLINLSSTTLNYNASKVISGTRFATTTAITGTNVYLTGVTSNAWTFTSHTGNLDGEEYDFDGGTECGSVRWSDSECLITQQIHYRWRSDDGGLGVPDSEWFDTDWSKRVPVRIDNVDSEEYTDAVVELSVTYDGDMQLDYDDLRFTDASGTTTIPYFIASTTNTTAEVWVKVPTLPAEDAATVYLYYGNALASSVSSSTQTFLAADDFEDNSLSEYDGAGSGGGDDLLLFDTNSTFAYGNTDYGLDNAGNVGSRANDGGIARFDQNFGPADADLGVTIRYMQYVSTNGGDDEVCTLFAVQSPIEDNENYAVCMEQVPGTDYITLSENITDTAVFSGTNLATSSVTYANGWYEVEVDWEVGGDMTMTLYNDSESQITQVSANDSTLTDGGFGFTYWGNEGGWDNFTVRPLLLTEPTIRFGAESVSGGANWSSEQDETQTTAPNATTRLRLTVENSGLAITNQTYDLEYAVKGAAPSCESVSGSNYAIVPNQASCGTSALCMQTTANYVSGAGTTDLLLGADGSFVAGQAIESPNSTTGNINIDQNYFTELEYAITATNNALSSNYCLRVTDAGGELDSYLEVAELIIRFDPTFGPVSFNQGQNISLLPGTTTRVYATSTVTDLNGYTDIVAATATMYTTTATAACAPDDNNCYVASYGGNCSLTNCSGNSCTLSCYADFYFHAEPTFSDGGEFWQAFLEAEDTQGGTGYNTSPSIDVFELAALAADGTINYGALEVASTTGTYNPTTTVQNYGNVPIDINVQGTNLSDGIASEIPAEQQLFATSTFDYSVCPVDEQCTELSTTTITNYELDLGKPTATSTPVEDYVYWGIEIPFGVAAHSYSGVNTFYAVTD